MTRWKVFKCERFNTNGSISVNSTEVIELREIFKEQRHDSDESIG